MVSKKSKLIFLMPPKTASNSISEMLLDSSINFDQEITDKPKIHLFLSELVELHDIEDISEYKIIQVLRHPIERYVSSYFHQIKLTKNVKTNFTGMNIDVFSKHLFKSLIKSEDDFLERFYGNTKFIKKAVNSGRSWGGSRLYLQQKQWNDMGADVKYFHLDDISENLELLSDYVGVYLPELPNKNVGLGNTLQKEEYLHALNENSKNIVEFIYDEDFVIWYNSITK